MTVIYAIELAVRAEGSPAVSVCGAGKSSAPVLMAAATVAKTSFSAAQR